jgi:prepilin-type N-terminal cleavage/methylation domain-containing protein
MRSLVCKEVRENVKAAALGLAIYTLLLVLQYRNYVAFPRDMTHPLADKTLLWNTVWFGGIFGAVLGWLQIHNERRPDLWAFLLHRPLTRTQIFLCKALAGLGLYALVVGLPLLVFTAWALWPGHVAAPFELTMLRPLAAYVLTGVVFYFAGMLTGLRQARWYGSRPLSLGMALIVCLLMQVQPVWWRGFLVILLGAAILAVAVWGGFQTHGYYRGQPVLGKAALICATMLGSLIVAVLAAPLLSSLFLRSDRPSPHSSYAMTKEGEVFKTTQGPEGAWTIVDLEGKPLIDAKTGRPVGMAEFSRRVQKAYSIEMDLDKAVRPTNWTVADREVAVPWLATSDTLWYYWRRYGRLVGYDIATRRLVGSLGPNGFAQDPSGGGERFSNSAAHGSRRTIWTDTTLYLLDLDQRQIKPLFTTTPDDPILAASEFAFNGFDWDYTAVVTKRFIHLLTADGQPAWKAPYDSRDASYRQAEIYPLKPPGQFALWLVPSGGENKRAGWNLPTHVIWLACGQGVISSADLPPLPQYRSGFRPVERLVCAVAPPALLLTLSWLKAGMWPTGMPRELLLLSWGTALLVCLPLGWWLGRRYRLSLAAQAGWAVFHGLFGVPGLLAFLSVQEWPARVPCPDCQRLRLVDRQQCEHCGAVFAPPEKTGTEVFAPLLASQAAQGAIPDAMQLDLRRKGETAFTLVELLVVIAIIAVLASLLLAAISGAMGKARRITCTSNLRQINLGVRMYSDDANDKSPKPAAGASRPYSAYKELMKSYVGLRGQSSKQDKLFACPADTFYYDYLFRHYPPSTNLLGYVPESLCGRPDYDYSSYALSAGNLFAFGPTNRPGIAGLPLSRLLKKRLFSWRKL